MKSNKQQLFLGIDGGGSKCKAVILNNSMQVLGEGISGAANPFHNLERAQQSISHAAELALTDANLDISLKSELIAGVGLAGVNLPKYFDLMQQWQHPFKSMHLATDLHIACLGAHSGEDGAIMITGTGSCGYLTNQGESLVIGGHGFPHGDVCSGAWLGFKAVENVLLSSDGIIKDTSLTEKIFRELGCTDSNTLIETIVGNGATFYARLAIHVFDAADAGDKVAIEIITEGCQYFEAVFYKLMAMNPNKLSLIGGLKPRLMQWLPEAVATQISEPENPPEIGAVLFAMNEHKN
ncbi:BadF/BadG/BcrA/BcrD ATPase family protein [Thalassotalea fonticola]|uniref:BadF/BadG/BcrA/BcrD ATPase family protein n=1 Tax=Thalassotalea fonticola TaxID=3065649 RepID=A0ABZ0GQU4_9GAMM|nr:BadF/BadG/BcrA/BcrD ATPase family protein [Colwelliaceae bacterium S1-1]